MYSLKLEIDSNSKECTEKIKSVIKARVDNLNQAIFQIEKSEQIRDEWENSIQEANRLLYFSQFGQIKKKFQEDSEKEQEQEKEQEPEPEPEKKVETRGRKKKLFSIPKNSI